MRQVHGPITKGIERNRAGREQTDAVSPISIQFGQPVFSNACELVSAAIRLGRRVRQPLVFSVGRR